MKFLFKKQHFMTGIAALVCLFSVLTVISCRNTYETQADEVLVTGVTLSPGSKDVKMNVDGPFTITATVSPSHSSNGTVTWSIDTAGQEYIEIVSSTGKTAMIGLKKPGIATVTATANGKTSDGKPRTAICTVTVSPESGDLIYIESITINSDDFTLAKIGNTKTLTAIVLPEDAYNKNVRWVSNNEHVASVDDNGVVTAVGNGQASIIAFSVGMNADNDYESDSIRVTVSDPDAHIDYVTGITLDTYTLSLKVGDEETLHAEVTPSEAEAGVSWRSDNPGVADVNDLGVVKAHSVGTARIVAFSTLTADGSEIRSPICTVTVTESVFTPGPAAAAGANGTMIPKPAGSNWTRYEGEDADINNKLSNEKQIDKQDFFSEGFAAVLGGQDISRIDLDSDWISGGVIGYIHFEVYAQTAGAHLVNIVYNGDDTDKQVLIKLNNDKSHVLPLPKVGPHPWDRLISKQITLGYFNQGWNDLYISSVSSDCWANIDCIDINSPPEPGIPVTGVTLNKNTLKLKMGETTTDTLIAAVKPDDATYKGVSWDVFGANPAGCVTVSQTGVVTAIAPGTATVIAATIDGGFTAECAVTVEEATVVHYVDAITVTPTFLTMSIGDVSSPLSYEITPENATNKTVTWHSSNENVATVSSTGAVTAKAIGTANIFAQSVYTAEAWPVNSNNCVVQVVISSLTPGDAAAASANNSMIPKPTGWARYEGEDADIVTNREDKTEEHNFYSGELAVRLSNQDIANIALDSDWISGGVIGYVRFRLYVQTAGNYRINLVYNGDDANKQMLVKLNNDKSHILSLPIVGPHPWDRMISKQFTLGHFIQGWNDLYISSVSAGWANIDCIDIEADDPPRAESVSLNKTTLTLKMGETTTETLIATVLPDNAMNKNVTWSVINADPAGCVTVNSATGLVTALQAGTATVRVTTVDGGKTVDCTVTVQAAVSEIYVTGITVSSDTLNLLFGQSAPALTAVIAPDNATNKAITWHSSNTAVASVNSSTGVVTAGSVSGTANIYAQSTHTGGAPIVSNNCVVTVTANQLISAITPAVSQAAAYPAQAGYTRYEAESAQIHGGAKKSTDDPYAYSNGGHVAETRNNISVSEFPSIWPTGESSTISYVEFTINNSGASGDYQVNIIFLGQDDGKTIAVQVNDTPSRGHTFTRPTGGTIEWNTVYAMQLRLTLKNGSNTIRVCCANPKADWTNIDCIDVGTTPLP